MKCWMNKILPKLVNKRLHNIQQQAHRHMHVSNRGLWGLHTSLVIICVTKSNSRIYSSKEGPFEFIVIEFKRTEMGTSK